MNRLDAKSVVVGVNGSRAAVNAAVWAIDEALSRQLPLRLVYVIPLVERRKSDQCPSRTSNAVRWRCPKRSPPYPAWENRLRSKRLFSQEIPCIC